jgi:16S rRNA (guanine527-N7)-methyltransferase
MTSDIIYTYFSEFTITQKQQLDALAPLYNEWNQKINVISRKDIESLYQNHVLHSLSIAAVFDIQPGQLVIDIGTGGGFPGVPLAIFFPQTEFILVDSIGKKLKVVEALKSELGLQNITTIHSRAEDIKNRKFDLAVSRAVAPLKDLWSWTKPLLYTVRNQSYVRGLVCLKGGDLSAEISESGLKPVAVSLENIFKEEWFYQKYLLQVRW